MENRVLNEKQKLLIDSLPEEILSVFYLTGGTALSAFYLEHRLSNDLDFFTDRDETVPRVEYLTAILQGLEGVNRTHFERLFDRRIFAVEFEDHDILKVEFTSYPFPSIEDRIKAGRLPVDSPLNIITGKLLALSDRYDPKDFVNLLVSFPRSGVGTQV
ncbi:MAG: nucleotidyl transferase AbiEii/AbiGii toxin family protein [Thermodesulfobacteriota bacterium]